jgi:hypothetical protein
MKKNNAAVYVMLIIILLTTSLTAGCATQHKFKKFKAVPCPCEKENKR